MSKQSAIMEAIKFDVDAIAFDFEAEVAVVRSLGLEGLDFVQEIWQVASFYAGPQDPETVEAYFHDLIHKGICFIKDMKEGRGFSVPQQSWVTGYAVYSTTGKQIFEMLLSRGEDEESCSEVVLGWITELVEMVQ